MRRVPTPEWRHAAELAGVSLAVCRHSVGRPPARQSPECLGPHRVHHGARRPLLPPHEGHQLRFCALAANLGGRVGGGPGQRSSGPRSHAFPTARVGVGTPQPWPLRADRFSGGLAGAGRCIHRSASPRCRLWSPNLSSSAPLVAALATTGHSTDGHHAQRRPRPAPRTVCAAQRMHSACRRRWAATGGASLMPTRDGRRPDAPGLVPIVDIALRQLACTREGITAIAWPGRRGAATLRSALQLSDPRSESPWESLLRLLHVFAGFAHVESQALIRDETGRVVARADLLLTGTKRLHEYDGADHRDAAQHRLDLGREKTLARLGCERYGYTAAEIVQRPARIITDAEEAYGLRHDPRRLRRWRRAATESTLTAQGRARLRARLERYARASHRWDRVRP